MGSTLLTERSGTDDIEILDVIPSHLHHELAGTSTGGNHDGGGGDTEASSNPAEWLLVLCFSLAFALLIRFFVVQSYFIPSGSMETTLMIDDRVVVNKLAYTFGEPEQGDIVVFEKPPVIGGDIDSLIKRVIATGGDTVEGRDGFVYVNGEALDEDYLQPGVTTSDFAPIDIPDGYLWVMGDNRNNSADSRVFGPIPADTVIGRSFVKMWPFSDIGLL